MQRRKFTSGFVSAAACWAVAGSGAARAAGLSEGDAALGVRAALERGAASAVDLLGRPGGFLDNPKVRIPLPGFLKDVAKIARLTGQQQRLDLADRVHPGDNLVPPLAPPALDREGNELAPHQYDGDRHEELVAPRVEQGHEAPEFLDAGGSAARAPELLALQPRDQPAEERQRRLALLDGADHALHAHVQPPRERAGPAERADKRGRP